MSDQNALFNMLTSAFFSNKNKKRTDIFLILMGTLYSH